RDAWDVDGAYGKLLDNLRHKGLELLRGPERQLSLHRGKGLPHPRNHRGLLLRVEQFRRGRVVREAGLDHVDHHPGGVPVLLSLEYRGRRRSLAFSCCWRRGPDRL